MANLNIHFKQAYEDPKGTLLPLRKNYWMEALDTQHHSFIDFYKNHYQTLVRSNSTDLESTRSFFEWFYVTKVSLPSLPRHLMDQLRVQYLDATERGTYEIEIVDKRVRYIVSKEWVTTSSLRGYIFGNPWIFVMSPNDKVYIARKQNGTPFFSENEHMMNIMPTQHLSVFRPFSTLIISFWSASSLCRHNHY